jgi:site-specific recombinase XerD
MTSLSVVRPASTPLSRLIDDFLATCRARGLSPRTDIAYAYSLCNVLLPWCQREGITRVEELTGRALDRLSSELLGRTSGRGKPLSRHSVHSYIRPVRQMLTWAEKEGCKHASRTATLTP